jgi:hypothetical protein
MSLLNELEPQETRHLVRRRLPQRQLPLFGCSQLRDAVAYQLFRGSGRHRITG